MNYSRKDTMFYKEIVMMTTIVYTHTRIFSLSRTIDDGRRRKRRKKMMLDLIFYAFWQLLLLVTEREKKRERENDDGVGMWLSLLCAYASCECALTRSMTSLPLVERTDIHWQQRMCRLCGYKERTFFSIL